MERSSSRSKRSYYYDQDYDSQTLPRTKPRYNHHHGSSDRSERDHYRGGGGGHNHHRRGGGATGGGGRSPTMVTTSYRILCHDLKAGGVIGKSGSIIKAIRQETGAWINVHHLIPGDEERIIEISDTRRRDPDGRMPSFSPAQEALMMIHERILESDSAFGYRFDANDEIDEEDGGRGNGQRVLTRLVVAKPNVGSLLGKGGKIIEQMRMDTQTHIRILPRDHTLPQCVTMSEEIVQVVGDINAVKRAVAVISSRLRESQHRERSHFHGRERYFPPDDEFSPHINDTSRRSSMDGPNSGSRFSAGPTNGRSNGPTTFSSGSAFGSEVSPLDDDAPLFSGVDIVFRMLCPNNKIEKVIGETDGIIDLLRGQVGVDVRVNEPLPGSNERIVTISSDEDLDDELFPAQEALLHIQTRIVDFGPEKDDITTTRLLIPSSEIGCLEGQDGSLSEMKISTGADIQILPREELPMGTLEDDRLVQIVGEIGAAREALVEVTTRLRSNLCREISFPKDSPPPISGSGYPGSMPAIDVGSPDRNSTLEVYPGNDPPMNYQNVQTAITTQPSKEAGVSRGGSVDRKENDAPECKPIAPENKPSGLNRLSVPLVTRSTLEVAIPTYATTKLLMRSGSKLSQISELSGASVRLVEDRPEVIDKVIQISGTPEQAERAQSLLQGFILSTQDDAPES